MPLFNGRIYRNPKRFSNPFELAKAIDLYVDQVVGTTQETDKLGQNRGLRADGTIAWFDFYKKDGTISRHYHCPPSLGGLCLHLGFATKSTLMSYLMGQNKPLREVVASTLLWLETFYVENMQRSNAPIAAYQFLLSNMGWSRQSNPTEGREAMAPPPTQDSRALQPVINLNFVASSNSIAPDQLRRQLLSEADGDTAIINSIENQTSEPKQVQPDREPVVVPTEGRLLNAR